MSARAIPIVETPRIVSLAARLALLEAECIDFRRDLNRAIETPFGAAPLGWFEPDDPIVYSGDEDNVPVPGEEEA